MTVTVSTLVFVTVKLFVGRAGRIHVIVGVATVTVTQSVETVAFVFGTEASLKKGPAWKSATSLMKARRARGTRNRAAPERNRSRFSMRSRRSLNVFRSRARPGKGESAGSGASG